MNYLRFTAEKGLLLTYDDKEFYIGSIAEWDSAIKTIRAGPDYVKTPLICSSSIDFPEEYTQDPELIELCGMVRNA